MPSPRHDSGSVNRPGQRAGGGHRVWLTGYAAGTGPRPVRRLAADVAHHAAKRDIRLEGWEFGEGTVDAADGPGGEPVAVTVAGTALSWDGEETGHVRAALLVRGLPDARVGWDGRPARCEWALVAEAERRWTHRAPCPALTLGLVKGGFVELLPEDDRLRATLKGGSMSYDPLPAAVMLPVENLPPDRLEQALARLTASDRGEGVLVVSLDGAAHLAMALLDAGWATACTWPGLTTFVVVTAEGQQALARHLPDRCLPAQGARWFAPATDGCDDLPLKWGQIRRPDTLRRLVDQALQKRMRTAPQGPAADAAELLTPGAPLPVPKAPDPVEVLRKRVDELSRELDDTRRRLGERDAEIVRLRRLVDTGRDRADELRRKLTAAEETIRAREAENGDLAEQLAAAHADADRSAAAAELAEAELAEVVRQRGELALRLAAAGTGRAAAGNTTKPGDAFGEASGDPVPDDFGALVTEAVRRFELLVLDAVDLDVARQLDQYPHAATWRRRAWDALSTLNAYARARLADEDVGDLRTFCRAGCAGALIAAGIIATGEHEGVQQDARFRRARTFRVRPETDPSGEAFHGAHIRLGPGRPPAPRLHFLDDTGRTGRVYVGYIGPHLPNRRTN